jgi:8-oxo-dGTP pyrophosphatase MutT (NUDIX family)
LQSKLLIIIFRYKFTDMKQLTTVGVVVIKNRQLLLAYSNNKRAWYLPGGKIDRGESTIQALLREIYEELNIVLKQEELHFYTHICAPAYGEDNETIMQQDCFFCILSETPRPTAEIDEVQYFNSISYTKECQVPGVILLMQKLKEDDLID